MPGIDNDNVKLPTNITAVHVGLITLALTILGMFAVALMGYQSLQMTVEFQGKRQAEFESFTTKRQDAMELREIKTNETLQNIAVTLGRINERLDAKGKVTP